MSKISELSNGGALLSTDDLIVVRSGGNVRAQLSSLNGIAIGSSTPAAGTFTNASATNVSLPDDGILSLGDSDELTLKHHNSGYSHLINTTGTLYIDSDSVTFRDDDASPENLVISQTGIVVTGNVGIGTSSMSSYYAKNLVVMADGDGTGGITIAAPATDDNTYLAFADGTSGAAAYAGYIGYSHSSEYLFLGGGAETTMYVQSKTRVGIGGAPNANWRNDSTDRILTLGTEAALHSDSGLTTELWNNAYVDNSDTFRNISTRGASRYRQYAGKHEWWTAASASAGSNVNTEIHTTPKMTLDVSGNLLVSLTSTSGIATGSTASNGAYIDGSVGAVVSQSSSNKNFYAAKASGYSDPDFMTFQVAGSTVGSISTASGYLVIGSPVGSDAHLLIGNGLIHPATSTGGAKDNAIDIGGSSNRFKDLYLSGGVFLGGTAAANKLDDYEEGQFTMTVSGVSGGAFGYGKYVKIGALVHWQWYSGAMTVTGSGYATLTGLPFTTSSSSGYYSTFATAHNTYSGTATNGYTQVGGVNAYIVAANTTSSAAYVAGYPKYIMVSGTYYTDD